MKKKIIVVGGREEAGGYRLAGVSKTYDAGTPGLSEKLAGQDALIFITPDAKARLAADLEKIRAKNIVQEIPSDAAGYSRVRDVIKSTIGFDLT